MTRHEYRCAVRWSDMDAYGHVNNAVFLTYLEEARSEFLGVRAAEAGADTFAAGCVSARHEISFKTPLEWRAGATVVVEVWVTHIKAVSFNLAYEIRGEAAVYAKAASTMVPYDLAGGRPRRLTEAERAFLNRFRPDRTVPA